MCAGRSQHRPRDHRLDKLASWARPCKLMHSRCNTSTSWRQGRACCTACHDDQYLTLVNRNKGSGYCLSPGDWWNKCAKSTLCCQDNGLGVNYHARHYTCIKTCVITSWVYQRPRSTGGTAYHAKVACAYNKITRCIDDEKEIPCATANQTNCKQYT